MCLPCLMVWAIVWGRNVTGVNADAVWFVKMAGTVLLPFGAVFWYLAITHLVLQKESSYLVQFLVFVATAVLVYLMLRTGSVRPFMSRPKAGWGMWRTQAISEIA